LLSGPSNVTASDPLELTLDDATWWMGHPFTHAITELARARAAIDVLRDEHQDAALAVLRHVFAIGRVATDRERRTLACALFNRAGLGNLDLASAGRTASRSDARLHARGSWLHGMLAASESSPSGVATADDPVAAAFVAALEDALHDRDRPTAHAQVSGVDARHGAALDFACTADRPRAATPEARVAGSTRELCIAEPEDAGRRGALEALALQLRPDHNGVVQAFGMLAARRFATADLRTMARLGADGDPMVHSAIREIARETTGTMLRQIVASPEWESMATQGDGDPAARAAAGTTVLRGLRWGHCRIVELRPFRSITVAVTRAWGSRALRRAAEVPTPWAQGCALGIAEHAHGLRNTGRAPPSCRLESTDVGGATAIVVTASIT
jgi:hypothetical protein